MDKIFFATGNKEKAREAQAILGVEVEIADIEVDEVQSMDLEYVARRKAEEAFRKIKKPVLVDDVGFYISAWNGFPGPLIKFLDKARGNQGILQMMEGEKNRSVKIQSAIGYHDGSNVHVFIGEINAHIGFEEKGIDGWGFDPIVIREGETKTIAELGFDHKNKVSHRAKSLQMLKEFLDSKAGSNEV